jgi:hypothetical protein
MQWRHRETVHHIPVYYETEHVHKTKQIFYIHSGENEGKVRQSTFLSFKDALWTHNLILTLTLTLKVKLIFVSGEGVFE